MFKMRGLHTNMHEDTEAHRSIICDVLQSSVGKTEGELILLWAFSVLWFISAHLQAFQILKNKWCRKSHIFRHECNEKLRFEWFWFLHS